MLVRICMLLLFIGLNTLTAQGPSYQGTSAEHIAFQIGGMGAGMLCLEGSGAISHFSIRNTPDTYNGPPLFAAISVNGRPESARVIERPVPDWKKFGQRGAAIGQPDQTWARARLRQVSFSSRFPFATNTGFGDVRFHKGKVLVDVAYDQIDVNHISIQ